MHTIMCTAHYYVHSLFLFFIPTPYRDGHGLIHTTVCNRSTLFKFNDKTCYSCDFKLLCQNKRLGLIGIDIASLISKAIDPNCEFDRGVPDNISRIEQKFCGRKLEMKKVMIKLIIVSVVVASYALPVLARGGAGF